MEMLETVRKVAATLVDDLVAAERETLDWRDEPLADTRTNEALSRALERLEQTDCWGPANRLPSGELWRAARRWLETGDLQVHARTKPRGYAGDFEMLFKICTEQTCRHPLGRAFDRFFQSRTAPQAVRNRTAHTAAAIQELAEAASSEPVHVVSIGSGPAEDVRRAAERLADEPRSRLRVTLIDLDPAALQFARTRLGGLLADTQVQYVRENLYRLPRLARARRLLSGSDLIFCTGLFDYLPDDDAATMLAALHAPLRQDGRLSVWNFAPHHPSQSYMEWIGNWYLTYRDSSSLAELAARAGLAEDACTIDPEATGTDLCLTVRKTGTPADS